MLAGAVNDRILIRSTGLVYGTSVNQLKTTSVTFWFNGRNFYAQV
jgi:hypothetical protein